MSAWNRMVSWDGSDEYLALCNAALVEVQREYAGRLARQVRDANPDRSEDWSDGVDWAADFIDPNVTQ